MNDLTNDPPRDNGPAQPTVGQFGRLDILVNNAGLMLLVPSAAPMSMSGSA
jgi:NAD(P)-dependent dehydrogenase (short-subunit alcohol dehydrogenase family)